MLYRFGLVLIVMLYCNQALPQCGGLDIFIANDQSGSVDAQENIKSREFIVNFAQHLPLANTAGGYRIAIADWDYNGGYQQFNFPTAGKTYTTNFSDILSYAASPRVLYAGTDIVLALQQSYLSIQQDPTNRPKIILLLTDAVTGNIEPGITEVATQIKANGIYIAIVSIAAASNTVLANAASPGGYFIADSYEGLANEASSYTAAIGAAVCTGSQPAFDLSLQLTSYQGENCFPGPGNYTLGYAIKNNGNEPWNDSITLSLYNGDLYDVGTSLVTVFKTPKVTLQPGETYTGTYTSTTLRSYSTLNAIVNFDGAHNPVAIPVYPFELYPLLQIPGERSPINNYSNLIARTNGVNCTPIANVVVDVQPTNMACGNRVGYAVNICNKGTQDTRITNFAPVANSLFALVHADVNIQSTNTAYTNTYFGGLNADYAYAATTDPFGAVYMAGQTNSATGIATAGAYRTSNGGTQDAFLTKFNAAGQRLWATYFGGTGPENGYSVTTDKQGNIYLTGETSISTNIATTGSYQPANGGSYDAYLAKFSPNGALLWSTYYGGAGADYGRGVATDNDGNVYLAGYTASINAIATATAHQAIVGGGNDAFLVKFNSSGVRQWATYYGGSGTESGFGVAVDGQNNVYLTGLTGSTANISTTGSYQAGKSTGNDAYIVKFNSNGVRQWGTYFGGNNSDNATAIAVDAQNSLYIAGNTSSTNIGTATAFQATTGGGTDAFLSKFDANGQLLWATYYGNSGTENGREVHAGRDGFIYLSGTTTSATGIATANAIQPALGGSTDAFLVKFTTTGSREWGTYFGGTADDVASAAVTDALGKVYLTGATQSPLLGTPGAYQENYASGGNDAFLMSLDEQSSFILKAGDCITLNYYYDASQAPAGNYDFSFLLHTEKLYATDPDAVVTPDADGFTGTNHTTDDVTLAQQTPACLPGDKVSIDVSIPATSICGDATYVTATVAINNTSGTALQQAVLHLDLSGTDAHFASELYDGSNNIRYARPNLLDPLYPNSNNAIVNRSGTFTIPLYDIPPGTSTLKADIAINASDLVLSTFVADISTFFNSTGQTNTAISQNAVTLTALPAIAGWGYPATITPGTVININNITTTNASQLEWASATAGKLTNGGSVQQPSLTYTPSATDIANGYVDISLTALNAAGCDVSKIAHIVISNVQYDYGDAPAVYDMQQTKIPVAASATLLPGLYLGKLAPTADAIAKSSAAADGDGAEEDALADKCPAAPAPHSFYLLNTTITNQTDKAGFINGFIDWNNDGDFLDTGEAAITIGNIQARSGAGTYTLWFSPPADVDAARYMVRLRISSDSAAIAKSYGPAPEGETEDHWLVIGNNKTSYQQKTICQGTAFTIGNHTYTLSGNYTDTVIMTSGCDSIIHTSLTVTDCGDNYCGPFFPTAFTPDGNGKNEGFGAVIRCAVSQYRLIVYNRWGQKVFESTAPTSKWDGKYNNTLQQTAIFAWQCSYNINGRQQIKKGIVTLVR